MSETPPTPEKVSPAPAPPKPEPTTVDLPRGVALPIDDANAIVGSRPVRFIIIAGPAGCGKTTLLTSLYESFQWNTFAGYRFFGSQTLAAFEERCFLARVASGKEEPETARTTLMDPVFLHLRLLESKDPHRDVDLLITDLPGEVFSLAKDSSEECKRLGFLRRADHLTLIVDGRKLCGSKTCWPTAQDSYAILQALLDNGVMPEDAHVDVLFSKWDFIERSSKKAEIEGVVAKIEKQFRDRFEARLGPITFRKISARPRGGVLHFAYGIDYVLRDWIASSPWLRPADLRLKEIGRRESELFDGLRSGRVVRTR
jgi:hypothetical protein